MVLLQFQTTRRGKFGNWSNRLDFSPIPFKTKTVKGDSHTSTIHRLLPVTYPFHFYVFKTSSFCAFLFSLHFSPLLCFFLSSLSLSLSLLLKPSLHSYSTKNSLTILPSPKNFTNQTEL